MLLFGPQAERKEGVAPALLTYLPAYRFCSLGFVSICTVAGYKIEGGKPTRKTVRKTEFSTVFRYFNLFFTTYEVLSCEDLEAEEFALFYQMAGIFRQSRSAPLSHNLR